jgi:hypothetical protein
MESGIRDLEFGMSWPLRRRPVISKINPIVEPAGAGGGGALQPGWRIAILAT